MSDFSPRWASPPGDTIADLLEIRGITSREAAVQANLSSETFDLVIAGDREIDLRLATVISGVLGGTPNFWLERERQYQADHRLVEADEWAQTLPVADMKRFGWIAATNRWDEVAEECLSFFGADSVGQWEAEFGGLLGASHFRSSNRFSTSNAAVAVWLRKAQVLSVQSAGPSWSRDEFVAALASARELTTERDPEIFIPKLRDVCRVAGVQLEVLRTPSGAPISGAVAPMTGGRRLLVLSARFLSDDHFWFTFFHEAAHLLLHPIVEPFLEALGEPESGYDQSHMEDEADELAESLLLGEQVDPSILGTRPRGFKSVVRLASHLQIAPGILVGMLQHRGSVRFDQLNGLKRRYAWAGSTLEMKRTS